MRVGFIGLGRMGNPMVRNLLKGGFDVVVNDIVESAVREVEGMGAVRAGSPVEVAKESEIVLTCLPTVKSVEEVYLGQNGLVNAVRKGQIVADHSTVNLRTSKRMKQEIEAKGAVFLDAPISGGPEGAQEATLSIMVGGDEEAFEKAKPAFEAMGRLVRRMGPSGAGTVTKLVNQLLTAVHIVSAGEALVLGTKAGVNPKDLLDVLMVSYGYSKQLERLGAMALARDFTPGGPNHIINKDITCALELGQDVGSPTPLLEATFEISNKVMEMGLKDWDMASMMVALEKEAGVEVKE